MVSVVLISSNLLTRTGTATTAFTGAPDASRAGTGGAKPGWARAWASRSACTIRPAGPVARTRSSGMPSSQARRRTAGEAIGRSKALPCVTRAAAAASMACRTRSPASSGGGTAKVGRTGTAGSWAGWAAGRAVPAAGAAPAFRLPSPSTSRRISSEPTATARPMLPPSVSTRPATGEGISTVALSVITSASTWSATTVSPSFTCQATSSTSAMPSPMSGVLMMYVPIMPPWREERPRPRGRGRGNTATPGRADRVCPSR
ncbi:MAG: hypothetical protein BWX79_02943 [Alphaproteobacteria bacterium ADurb.Bin100]|nr:MAG: hypothetical protein BWX79_02943 [Alphaproteobacteria bacterium ADurb.Bin100]